MTAPNAFEKNRKADWRATVDANGVPTHAPLLARCGCHYCGGDLDANPGVGQYECPWCIARFDSPSSFAEPTPYRLGGNQLPPDNEAAWARLMRMKKALAALLVEHPEARKELIEWLSDGPSP